MLLAAGLTALAVVPLVVSREVRTLPTPDRWPGVADDRLAATLEV